MLHLQWLPSYFRQQGNHEAEHLAPEAHHDQTPFIFINLFSYAHYLIHRILNLRHPDSRASLGTLPQSLSYRGASRSDIPLVHCLRCDCAFTRTALQRMQLAQERCCYH